MAGGVIADLTVVLKTDNKAFKKGIDGATTKTQAMKNAIKNNMGEIKIAAVAAAAAVTAAIGFSIKQAQEAEKVNAKLANSLKNVGVVGDKTAKQMEALASSLQKTTGVGDEDLKEVMIDLTNITGNYNVALEHTETVANLAAGANINLRTAAQLMGRAYLGDTTMLKRYGIVLKEGISGTEALDAVNKKFYGAAAARLNTFDGQIENLKNSLSDMGENLGKKLIKPLTNLIVDLNRAIEFWDEFINKGEKIEVLHPALKKINDDIDEQKKILKLANEQMKYYQTGHFESREAAIAFAAKGKHAFRIIQGEIINTTATINRLTAEYKKTEDQIKRNGETSNKTTDEIIENSEAIKRAEENGRKVIEAREQQAKDSAAAISEAFQSMGAAIVSNEMNISEGLKAAAKSGIAAILDALQVRAQAELAISTAQLLSGNPAGAAGIAGWGTAIAGLETLKAGVLSLADGGIVSSPTMAMVGDNRRSPEVVAPLDQLKPMITQAVNNSSSNSMNLVINTAGFGDAEKITRTEIIPAIDKYFKLKGVKNDFTK